MDVATIIGMVVSFGLISAAIILNGDPLLFFDLPSALIVLGGTLGATLTQYPLSSFMQIGALIRKTLVSRTPETALIIEQFLDYAGRTRREGILSLEGIVNAMSDPYLKKAMQLTVDGLEPEAIQDILETEIQNTEARHEVGVDLLRAMASYSPAIGMMGTVIGLVQMLENMSDPSTIGKSMALALLTTFYGTILANLVFLPLMGKLRQRSREEILLMEMQREGVLGISRGENPRIIREKLNCFQAPKERRRTGP
ncbi:MAG: motility protein A [Desulfovibrio sp.]|nr:motility protein A [Desulfovibrio sp.]